MSNKSDSVLLAASVFCVFCVIICCGFYVRLEFRLQAFEKRILAVERRNAGDKTEFPPDLATERKALQVTPREDARIRLRRSDDMITIATSVLIEQIASEVYNAIGKYCVNEPNRRMCIKGSQGPAGAQGVQGPKGDAGVPGKPGAKGDKCEECSETPVGGTRGPDLSGNPIDGPGIFVSPSTLTKGENEMARFTCNGGRNNGEARASWSRLEGKAFPAGRTTAGKDGILRIVSLQVEDAGEYMCSVTSDSRVAHAKVRLTVHAPPRISLDSGPTYVKMGTNITLPICHVTGFPLPVVTWAKVLDRLPRARLFVGPQTLSILDARKADSGSYICKATSAAGSSRQATQVVVTMVPKFTLRPLPITDSFAGSSVTFRCQATGSPVPSISWENACFGKLPQSRIVTSNGSLTIRALQSKDSGRYFCKATSGLFQERAAFELRIKIARDCSMLYSYGIRDNGVYTVDPDNQGPFEVFCDMWTDGGGWTVFQRRQDDTVSFFRSWDEYKTGFGDLNGNFWLGNEKIHRLTKHACILRVDLEDWEGNKNFAKYGQFRLGNESTKYPLTVASFSGTVEDKLKYHNGKLFTTKDNDNDRRSGENCAVKHMGAWWYDNCLDSNLNGQYVKQKAKNTLKYEKMTWDFWNETQVPLKTTELKLRMH